MTPRSGRRALARDDGTSPAPAGRRSRSDPFGAAPAWIERVVAGEQPTGPRGRVGVVWFVVAVLSAYLGLVPLALLFAGVAAVAALQTVAAWREARATAVRAAAASSAALLPISAAFGIALVGLVVLIAVVGALVAAVLADRERRHRIGGGRPAVLGLGGVVVRAGILPGLVAASAVLVARTDVTTFVVLLLLISGYEMGDYLVGTGAGSRIEGPAAGIAAVLVLTFGVAVYQLGVLDTTAAWVFGGLVAATAPLGPLVAAALVPTATAVGPALRRLDSWIVTGPLWAWMLWDYTS
ncbi:MAG: hypothetical protein MUE36_02590 [Acidimicrobiales bacterium]|jgi:hypothetical protein|nr:hypothetical protein [Acidimicrobiales bacterium]